MTKDVESPAVGVKKSRHWNRELCYACFTLALMAAGFAATYLGIKFGLPSRNDVENVTISDDGILVSPRTIEINPLTPFTQIFTQSVNNSTADSIGNVSDVTEKILASSSPKILEPQCVPRNLTFCSNHLNYTHTFYPNIVGDMSEHDFIGSWKFLQTVVDSLCHPMVEEFICLAAQPECRQDSKILGPCRKVCHEIAKSCISHVWSVLEKERIIFNCDEQYFDSEDPNLCHSMKSIASSFNGSKV